MTDANHNLIDVTITFAEFSPNWSKWELPESEPDYWNVESLSKSLQELEVGTMHPQVGGVGSGAKGSEFGGLRFYFTLTPNHLERLIIFAHEWAGEHASTVQLKSFQGSTVLLQPDLALEAAEVIKIVKMLEVDEPGIKLDMHEQELIEAAVEQKALISLRYILQNRFNESEVRQLCFDLGIDYEQFEGNSHPDRVISMLNYMKRRGKLNALIELGRSHRDYIAWPNLRRSNYL